MFVGRGGIAPRGRLSGVMGGIVDWAARGAAHLIGEIGKLMDRSTQPELRSAWFSERYAAMVRLSTALAGVFLLLAAFFVSAHGFSSILFLDNVRQAAPLGVVVAGQALVLMMGRLDLSVGATASMANIVLCSVFDSNMANLAPALAATLAAGVLVGLANGLMSTKLGIPAFLATLADVAEHRFYVALSAGDGLVHAAQGVPRPIVVEFWNGSNRRPPACCMAILTRNSEVPVRTASSARYLRFRRT